jgi:predicted tellurium resistance membrane protein TerC
MFAWFSSPEAWIALGTLIVEGFDVHVPKGYIYFAMAFSMGVEMLNIRMRKKQARPLKLNKSISEGE